MTRRTAALLASVALASFTLACGGGDGGDSPTGPGDGQASVDRIEVTPGADTATALGDTQEYEAVALTSGGDTVSGVSFTWESTDEAVATVDDQGVAEAVANGDAEIRASADGVTGSAAMAVIQQVSSVSISPSAATLVTVGDTANFSASAADENGNAVSDVEFVWQSQNHAVATVDSTGLVTSRGNGETSITVTAQDVPAHATLTVNQAVDHLVFRTEPTGATAGEAIDPAVQVAVMDSAGNVVENAESAVTLAIGSNPGGATLGGAATVNAVNGVATFSNVWLDVAATGYTLEASVSGVSSAATSQSFDVSAAGPARLSFVTQPSNSRGQEPISPGVEVEVRDEFGNLVTSGVDVSLSLYDDPTGGEASLSGTTTVATSSGVATFGDLSIARPGNGYTVRATAGSSASATSASFAVNLDFVQTSAGSGHTCAVTAADHAYCWGSNDDGELGNDTTTLEATTRPEPVAGGHAFTQVGAGEHHTCAITASDELYCWGRNSWGQLGDGTTTLRSTPVAVDVSSLSTQTMAGVSGGFSHTCARTTTDEVYCWGRNHFGQLGDGTTNNSTTPVAVSTALTFGQVSAGSDHVCAITTADEAYCWGNNSFGELGDGSTTDRSSPVAVDVSGLATQTFKDLAAGGGHTCAITTGDDPYCWGSNSRGQLGDGTTTESSTPVAVSASTSFDQATAGDRHTCMVTYTGEGRCWGNNSFGQLGDGTTTHRSTPVKVSSIESFVQLTAGTSHTAGLTSNGAGFGWGRNGVGQLGDGTTTNRTLPVAVIQ